MTSKVTLFLLGLPGVSALFLAVVAAAQAGELPAPATLVTPALVILLLVLLNGFFVAAEIAIVGVRPGRVEQLVEEGHKAAARVLHTVTSRPDQDQYIATAQLGITMASLALAMYGQPQIAHFVEPYLAQLLASVSTLGPVWWLPDFLATALSGAAGSGSSDALVTGAGYVIALSLLAYLHIVLGEMAPKSLALTDSARVAMLLAGPMQVFRWILAYPVRILNGIGRLLLRLFRIPPVEGESRVLSQEELELIVTESAEGGLLQVEEEEMIRNIFDFGDRTVVQVLTPRRKVQAISADMSLEEILQIVVNSRHSRFPVYDGDLDHIVGILHIKDLVKQSLKNQSRFDLRLLLRAAPAIPEDYPVEALLAAFKRQRLHMAIVLDEFGGMIGVVTLEDLVEEIVGEVRDEFDLEKEPFVQIAPGIIEVAGEYLVDDLLDDIVFLGNSEPLPEVETVGGLIVAKLGRPPVAGDEVAYNEGRVRMKVLAVDGRAVTRARIEFPNPEQEEAAETAVAAETNTDDGPMFLSSVIEQLRERRKKWHLF